MKMNNISFNLAAQSTYFKLKRSTSKDSGIFLDNTVYEMLVPYFSGKDEKGHDTIDFLIFKEDCIKALANIMCSLPLFSSVAGLPKEENNAVEIYLALSKQISDFFGDNDSAVLSSLYFTDLQGRKYLWGTEGKRRPFELRKFFVANHTELFFNTEDSSPVILRFKTHIVSDNKEEFEPLEVKDVPSFIESPLQVIYYGAPGTGKSHTIQQMTNDDNSVRITFHPDSDYASFVGTYKPTMSEVPVFVPFGNTVTEAIDGQGNPVKEKKIQYEFIPQTFLTAYVEAWKRMAQGATTDSPAKDYYLVIEEINRGNCAQIFGDLFQLLDRNADGYSSYSIKPDKDLQNFLATNKEGFADPKAFPDGSIPEKIRTGQQMLLPPNLHIWATMNTSDQSLFPIDSAFKRRWDWVYIPISKGIDKTTGKEIDWVVRAGGIDWDWWSFLEQINPVIYSTTQSEDKKLGFFFARATGGVITAEQFVGKVIFYIWNDVFKDFGLDRDEFKNHNAKNGENDRLSFDKFFMPDGSPNEDNVVMLMENLKVKKVTDKEEASAQDTEETE